MLSPTAQLQGLYERMLHEKQLLLGRSILDQRQLIADLRQQVKEKDGMIMEKDMTIGEKDRVVADATKAAFCNICDNVHCLSEQNRTVAQSLVVQATSMAGLCESNEVRQTGPCGGLQGYDRPGIWASGLFLYRRH